MSKQRTITAPVNTDNSLFSILGTNDVKVTPYLDTNVVNAPIQNLTSDIDFFDNSWFGEGYSTYAKRFVPTGDPTLDLRQVQQSRYEGQGYAMRFLNSVPRILGSTLGYVAQGAAMAGGTVYAGVNSLADLIIGNKLDATNFSDIYDNLVTNAITDYGEGVKKLFPNYASPDYHNKGLVGRMGESQFWLGEGGDALAFVASAYVGGAGVLGLGSKATKGLAKLGIFGQRASTALRTSAELSRLGAPMTNMQKAMALLPEATVTAYNTINEAGIEALGVKRQLMQEYDAGLWGKDLTREEAELKVAERANATFGYNAAVLVVPNFIQTRIFHGKASFNRENIERALNEQSLNYGSKLVKAGKGMVREGAWEEAIQSSIERYENNLLTDKNTVMESSEYKDGLFGGIYNIAAEWFKGWSNTDQQAAALLGGIVGGGMSMIDHYKDKTETDKAISRLLRAANMATASYNEDYKNLFKKFKITDENGVEKEVNTNPETGKQEYDERIMFEKAQQLHRDEKIIQEQLIANLSGDDLRNDMVRATHFARLATTFFGVEFGDSILAHKIKKAGEALAANPDGTPTEDAPEIIASIARDEEFIKGLKTAYDTYLGKLSTPANKKEEAYNNIKLSGLIYEAAKRNVLQLHKAKLLEGFQLTDTATEAKIKETEKLIEESEKYEQQLLTNDSIMKQEWSDLYDAQERFDKETKNKQEAEQLGNPVDKSFGAAMVDLFFKNTTYSNTLITNPFFKKEARNLMTQARQAVVQDVFINEYLKRKMNDPKLSAAEKIAVLKSIDRVNLDASNKTAFDNFIRTNMEDITNNLDSMATYEEIIKDTRLEDEDLKDQLTAYYKAIEVDVKDDATLDDLKNLANDPEVKKIIDADTKETNKTRMEQTELLDSLGNLTITPNALVSWKGKTFEEVADNIRTIIEENVEENMSKLIGSAIKNAENNVFDTIALKQFRNNSLTMPFIDYFEEVGNAKKLKRWKNNLKELDDIIAMIDEKAAKFLAHQEKYTADYDTGIIEIGKGLGLGETVTEINEALLKLDDAQRSTTIKQLKPINAQEIVAFKDAVDRLIASIPSTTLAETNLKKALEYLVNNNFFTSFNSPYRIFSQVIKVISGHIPELAEFNTSDKVDINSFQTILAKTSSTIELNDAAKDSLITMFKTYRKLSHLRFFLMLITSKINLKEHYTKNKFTAPFLSPQQQVVYEQAIIWLNSTDKDLNAFVIEGSAGTGKTFLIEQIINNADVAKSDILIMSPYQQAQDNLRDKLGLTNDNILDINSVLSTISGLMSVIDSKLPEDIYNLFEATINENTSLKAKYDKYFNNKNKVIVIDEAYKASKAQQMFLMYLKTTYKAKLLLAGDSYQLGSSDGIANYSTAQYLVNLYHAPILSTRFRSFVAPIASVQEAFYSRVPTTTIQTNFSDTIGVRSFIEAKELVEDMNLKLTNNPGKTFALLVNNKSDVAQTERFIKDKISAAEIKRVSVLTVEDAQGREFDFVYIDLPANNSSYSGVKLAHSRLLYTALSRAKAYIGVIRNDSLDIESTRDNTLTENIGLKKAVLEANATAFAGFLESRTGIVAAPTVTPTPSPTPTESATASEDDLEENLFSNINIREEDEDFTEEAKLPDIENPTVPEVKVVIDDNDTVIKFPTNSAVKKLNKYLKDNDKDISELEVVLINKDGKYLVAYNETDNKYIVVGEVPASFFTDNDNLKGKVYDGTRAAYNEYSNMMQIPDEIKPTPIGKFKVAAPLTFQYEEGISIDTANLAEIEQKIVDRFNLEPGTVKFAIALNGAISDSLPGVLRRKFKSLLDQLDKGFVYIIAYEGKINTNGSPEQSPIAIKLHTGKYSKDDMQPLQDWYNEIKFVEDWLKTKFKADSEISAKVILGNIPGLIRSLKKVVEEADKINGNVDGVSIARKIEIMKEFLEKFENSRQTTTNIENMLINTLNHILTAADGAGTGIDKSNAEDLINSLSKLSALYYGKDKRLVKYKETKEDRDADEAYRAKTGNLTAGTFKARMEAEMKRRNALLTNKNDHWKIRYSSDSRLAFFYQEETKQDRRGNEYTEKVYEKVEVLKANQGAAPKMLIRIVNANKRRLDTLSGKLLFSKLNTTNPFSSTKLTAKHLTGGFLSNILEIQNRLYQLSEEHHGVTIRPITLDVEHKVDIIALYDYLVAVRDAVQTSYTEQGKELNEGWLNDMNGIITTVRQTMDSPEVLNNTMPLQSDHLNELLELHKNHRLAKQIRHTQVDSITTDFSVDSNLGIQQKILNELHKEHGLHSELKDITKTQVVITLNEDLRTPKEKPIVTPPPTSDTTEDEVPIEETPTTNEEIVKYNDKPASIVKKSRSKRTREVIENEQFDDLISQEEFTSLAKQLMPDISDDDIIVLSSVVLNELADNNRLVSGFVNAGKVYVSSIDGKVSKRVAIHELFHRVFSHYLSKTDRNKLLAAYEKTYGEKVHNKADFEEKLARRFETFKSSKYKIVNYLLKFFNKIASFLNFITTHDAAINELFLNIQLGKYKTQNSKEEIAEYEHDFGVDVRYYEGMDKDFTTHEEANNAQHAVAFILANFSGNYFSVKEDGIAQPIFTDIREKDSILTVDNIYLPLDVFDALENYYHDENKFKLLPLFVQEGIKAVFSSGESGLEGKPEQIVEKLVKEIMPMRTYPSIQFSREALLASISEVKEDKTEEGISDEDDAIVPDAPTAGKKLSDQIKDKSKIDHETMSTSDRIKMFTASFSVVGKNGRVSILHPRLVYLKMLQLMEGVDFSNSFEQIQHQLLHNTIVEGNNNTTRAVTARLLLLVKEAFGLDESQRFILTEDVNENTVHFINTMVAVRPTKAFLEEKKTNANLKFYGNPTGEYTVVITSAKGKISYRTDALGNIIGDFVSGELPTMFSEVKVELPNLKLRDGETAAIYPTTIIQKTKTNYLLENEQREKEKKEPIYEIIERRKYETDNDFFLRVTNEKPTKGAVKNFNLSQNRELLATVHDNFASQGRRNYSMLEKNNNFGVYSMKYFEAAALTVRQAKEAQMLDKIMTKTDVEDIKKLISGLLGINIKAEFTSDDLTRGIRKLLKRVKEANITLNGTALSSKDAELTGLITLSNIYATGSDGLRKPLKEILAKEGEAEKYDVTTAILGQILNLFGIDNPNFHNVKTEDVLQSILPLLNDIIAYKTSPKTFINNRITKSHYMSEEDGNNEEVSTAKDDTSAEVVDNEEDLAPSIVQYLKSRYNSSLRAMSNTAVKDNDFLRVTTIKAADGKSRYVYSPSSHLSRIGMTLVAKRDMYLSDKITNIGTLLFLPDYMNNGFYKMNPILSDNLIEAMYEHDQHKFEDRLTPYTKETPMEYWEREFVGGYLSNIFDSSKSYLLFINPIEDRPNTIAFKLSLDESVLDNYKQLLLQLANRPEKDNLKVYDQRSTLKLNKLQDLFDKALDAKSDLSESDRKAILRYYNEGSKTFKKETSKDDYTVLAKLLKQEVEKDAVATTTQMLEARMKLPGNFWHIAKLLKNNFPREVQEIIDKYTVLQDIRDFKIPYDYEKGFNFSAIRDANSIEHDIYKTLNAMNAHWGAQHYVHNYFITQLLSGDVAHFPSAFAHIKRMGGVGAPGSRGIVNTHVGVPRHVPVGMITEPEGNIYANAEGKEDRETSLFKDIPEYDYSNATIDIMDGNALMLPERLEQLEAMFSSGKELGAVVKDAEYYIDETGKPIMLKRSTVVLSDSLVAAQPHLKIVRDNMRRLGIMELLPPSVQKVGQLKSSNLIPYEKMGEVMSDEDVEKYKLTAVTNLDNKEYKVQGNPIHVTEESVTNWSQFPYFLNILEGLEEEAAIAYDAHSQLTKLGMDKAKEMFSEDEIRNTLLQATRNSNAVDFSDMINANIDFDFPLVTNRVLTYINSSFSKAVIQYKFQGGKFVLQSDSWFKNPKTGERLQVRTDENGNLYYEAILPSFMKKYVNDGDILGVRIPTTEIHSATPIRVVGFYDSKGSNVIVLPQELMKITGHDFDVDSIFVLRREYDNPRFLKLAKARYISTEINKLFKNSDENSKVKEIINQLNNLDEVIMLIDEAKARYEEEVKEEQKTNPTATIDSNQVILVNDTNLSITYGDAEEWIDASMEESEELETELNSMPEIKEIRKKANKLYSKPKLAGIVNGVIDTTYLADLQAQYDALNQAYNNGTIEDRDIYYYKALRGQIEAVLKNQVIIQYLSAIQKEYSRERMLAPVSMAMFNGKNDNEAEVNAKLGLYKAGTVNRYMQDLKMKKAGLSVAAYMSLTDESKKESYATAIRNATKLQDRFDTSSLLGKRAAVQAVMDGEDLTGIFASFAKSLAYQIKAGTITSIATSAEPLSIFINKQSRTDAAGLLNLESKLIKLISSGNFTGHDLRTLLVVRGEIESIIETSNQLTAGERANPKYKLVELERTIFDKSNSSDLRYNAPVLKRSVVIDGVTYEQFSDTSNTWKLLDALVNASIDNVAEQILPIINGNTKTAEAIAAAIAIGIPINTVALLMNQHVITKLKSEKLDVLIRNETERLREKGYDIKDILLTLQSNIIINPAEAAEEDKQMTGAEMPVDDIPTSTNNLNTGLTLQSLEDNYGETVITDPTFNFKVLVTFKRLLSLGEATNKFSAAIVGLKAIPTDYKGLSKMHKAFSTFESNPKYVIEDALDNLPHIAAMQDAVNYLVEDLISNTIFIHNTEVISNLETMKNDFGLRLNSFNDEENMQLIKQQFAKFIVTSMANDIVNEASPVELALTKQDGSQMTKVLTGAEAYVHNVATELESIIADYTTAKSRAKADGVSFRTNMLLEGLEITTSKYGYKHIRFTLGANLSSADIFRLQTDLLTVPTNLNEDEVLTNTTTSLDLLQKLRIVSVVLNGMSSGQNTFTKGLPMVLIKEVSDVNKESIKEIKKLMRKEETALSSILQGFAVQLAAISPNGLTYIPSKKAKLQYRLTDTEAKIYNGTIVDGNLNLTYDFAYSLEDKNFKFPRLIKAGRYSTAYILVHQDSSTGYYRKLPKARSFRPSIDSEYTISEYFRTDIPYINVENFTVENGKVKVQDKEFQGSSTPFFITKKVVSDNSDRVYVDSRLNIITEIPTFIPFIVKSTPTQNEIEQNYNPAIVGENISSQGSELARKLTNPGNNLSVEFRGKVFRNSEHAYQTWKSGTFDEVAYNSTAFKPVGRLSANKAINFNLMVEIITAKLQQHLDLITEIQQRGGLSYIAASTHNVTGDMFWETSGQNKFIEALYQAAKNVGITSINNSDEDLTDDSNCNQPF